MRKLHLSYNTWDLPWVAHLYYTQTAPVLQYRDPALERGRGTSQYYTQTTPVVQYRELVIDGHLRIMDRLYLPYINGTS